jgi:hypothetical protein
VSSRGPSRARGPHIPSCWPHEFPGGDTRKQTKILQRGPRKIRVTSNAGEAKSVGPTRHPPGLVVSRPWRLRQIVRCASDRELHRCQAERLARYRLLQTSYSKRIRVTFSGLQCGAPQPGNMLATSCCVGPAKPVGSPLESNPAGSRPGEASTPPSRTGGLRQSLDAKANAAGMRRKNLA